MLKTRTPDGYKIEIGSHIVTATKDKKINLTTIAADFGINIDRATNVSISDALASTKGYPGLNSFLQTVETALSEDVIPINTIYTNLMANAPQPYEDTTALKEEMQKNIELEAKNIELEAKNIKAQLDSQRVPTEVADIIATSSSDAFDMSAKLDEALDLMRTKYPNQFPEMIDSLTSIRTNLVNIRDNTVANISNEYRDNLSATVKSILTNSQQEITRARTVEANAFTEVVIPEITVSDRAFVADLNEPVRRVGIFRYANNNVEHNVLSPFITAFRANSARYDLDRLGRNRRNSVIAVDGQFVPPVDRPAILADWPYKYSLFEGVYRMTYMTGTAGHVLPAINAPNNTPEEIYNNPSYVPIRSNVDPFAADAATIRAAAAAAARTEAMPICEIQPPDPAKVRTGIDGRFANSFANFYEGCGSNAATLRIDLANTDWWRNSTSLKQLKLFRLNAILDPTLPVPNPPGADIDIYANPYPPAPADEDVDRAVVARAASNSCTYNGIHNTVVNRYRSHVDNNNIITPDNYYNAKIQLVQDGNALTLAHVDCLIPQIAGAADLPGIYYTYWNLVRLLVESAVVDVEDIRTANHANNNVIARKCHEIIQHLNDKHINQNTTMLQRLHVIYRGISEILTHPAVVGNVLMRTIKANLILVHNAYKSKAEQYAKVCSTAYVLIMFKGMLYYILRDMGRELNLIRNDLTTYYYYNTLRFLIKVLSDAQRPGFVFDPERYWNNTVSIATHPGDTAFPIDNNRNNNTYLNIATSYVAVAKTPYIADLLFKDDYKTFHSGIKKIIARFTNEYPFKRILQLIGCEDRNMIAFDESFMKELSITINELYIAIVNPEGDAHNLYAHTADELLLCTDPMDAVITNIRNNIIGALVPDMGDTLTKLRSVFTFDAAVHRVSLTDPDTFADTCNATFFGAVAPGTALVLNHNEYNTTPDINYIKIIIDVDISNLVGSHGRIGGSLSKLNTFIETYCDICIRELIAFKTYLDTELFHHTLLNNMYKVNNNTNTVSVVRAMYDATVEISHMYNYVDDIFNFLIEPELVPDRYKVVDGIAHKVRRKPRSNLGGFGVNAAGGVNFGAGANANHPLALDRRNVDDNNAVYCNDNVTYPTPNVYGDLIWHPANPIYNLPANNPLVATVNGIHEELTHFNGAVGAPARPANTPDIAAISEQTLHDVNARAAGVARLIPIPGMDVDVTDDVAMAALAPNQRIMIGMRMLYPDEANAYDVDAVGHRAPMTYAARSQALKVKTLADDHTVGHDHGGAWNLAGLGGMPVANPKGDEAVIAVGGAGAYVNNVIGGVEANVDLTVAAHGRPAYPRIFNKPNNDNDVPADSSLGDIVVDTAGAGNPRYMAEATATIGAASGADLQNDLYGEVIQIYTTARDNIRQGPIEYYNRKIDFLLQFLEDCHVYAGHAITDNATLSAFSNINYDEDVGGVVIDGNNIDYPLQTIVANYCTARHNDPAHPNGTFFADDDAGGARPIGFDDILYLTDLELDRVLKVYDTYFGALGTCLGKSPSLRSLHVLYEHGVYMIQLMKAELTVLGRIHSFLTVNANLERNTSYIFTKWDAVVTAIDNSRTNFNNAITAFFARFNADITAEYKRRVHGIYITSAYNLYHMYHKTFVSEQTQRFYNIVKTSMITIKESVDTLLAFEKKIYHSPGNAAEFSADMNTTPDDNIYNHIMILNMMQIAYKQLVEARLILPGNINIEANVNKVNAAERLFPITDVMNIAKPANNIGGREGIIGSTINVRTGAIGFGAGPHNYDFPEMVPPRWQSLNYNDVNLQDQLRKANRPYGAFLGYNPRYSMDNHPYFPNVYIQAACSPNRHSLDVARAATLNRMGPMGAGYVIPQELPFDIPIPPGGHGPQYRTFRDDPFVRNDGDASTAANRIKYGYRVGAFLFPYSVTKTPYDYAPGGGGGGGALNSYAIRIPIRLLEVVAISRCRSVAEYSINVLHETYLMYLRAVKYIFTGTLETDIANCITAYHNLKSETYKINAFLDPEVSRLQNDWRYALNDFDRNHTPADHADPNSVYNVMYNDANIVDPLDPASKRLSLHDRAAGNALVLSPAGGNVNNLCQRENAASILSPDGVALGDIHNENKLETIMLRSLELNNLTDNLDMLNHGVVGTPPNNYYNVAVDALNAAVVPPQTNTKAADCTYNNIGGGNTTMFDTTLDVYSNTIPPTPLPPPRGTMCAHFNKWYNDNLERLVINNPLLVTRLVNNVTFTNASAFVAENYNLDIDDYPVDVNAGGSRINFIDAANAFVGGHEVAAPMGLPCNVFGAIGLLLKLYKIARTDSVVYNAAYVGAHAGHEIPTGVNPTRCFDVPTITKTLLELAQPGNLDYTLPYLDGALNDSCWFLDYHPEFECNVGYGGPIAGVNIVPSAGGLPPAAYNDAVAIAAYNGGVVAIALRDTIVTGVPNAIGYDIAGNDEYTGLAGVKTNVEVDAVKDKLNTLEAQIAYLSEIWADWHVRTPPAGVMPVPVIPINVYINGADANYNNNIHSFYGGANPDGSGGNVPRLLRVSDTFNGTFLQPCRINNIVINTAVVLHTIGVNRAYFDTVALTRFIEGVDVNDRNGAMMAAYHTLCAETTNSMTDAYVKRVNNISVGIRAILVDIQNNTNTVDNTDNARIANAVGPANAAGYVLLGGHQDNRTFAKRLRNSIRRSILGGGNEQQGTLDFVIMLLKYVVYGIIIVIVIVAIIIVYKKYIKNKNMTELK